MGQVLYVTPYSKSLNASVDAPAWRSLLGLGTLATQNGTFSGTSSGTNTGDQTDVTGNAATVTVADAAADTTTWVMLAGSQTGNQGPLTDAGLTFNASTNELTVAGSVTTPIIKPSADSTTAVQITNAAGTGFVKFDTTNNRVGFGVTPNRTVDILDAANPQLRLTRTDGASYSEFTAVGYTLQMYVYGGGIWTFSNDLVSAANLVTIGNAGGISNNRLVLDGAAGPTYLYTTASRSTFKMAYATSPSTTVPDESLSYSWDPNVTPSDGFGQRWIARLKSSTTAAQDATAITSAWSTASHASRTSYLAFETVNAAGALAERMRISGPGQVGVNKTTFGTNEMFGVNTPTTVSNLADVMIASGGATHNVCVVQLVPSQTGDALQVQYSTGDVAATITAAGDLDFKSNRSPYVGNTTFGGTRIHFTNSGELRLNGTANVVTTIPSTYSSSSSQYDVLTINPTVAQTLTAGSRALFVNPTYNAIGSGINYALHVKVAGTVAASIIPAVIQGAVSQTEPLISCQKSDGTTARDIDAQGRIITNITTVADATSITPNTGGGTTMCVDVVKQVNTQAAGNLTINADAGTPIAEQEFELVIVSTNAQTFIWNTASSGGFASVGTGAYSMILPTVTLAGATMRIKFKWGSPTASRWNIMAILEG